MALQGSLAIIPVIASKAGRRIAEDITHSGLLSHLNGVFPGKYRITMPVKSLSLLRPGKGRRVPSRHRLRPTVLIRARPAGLRHTHARSMPVASVGNIRSLPGQDAAPLPLTSASVPGRGRAAGTR